MVETMFMGGTFSDFILRPQKSVLESRSDPKRELTEMPLTRQLKTRVPVISANMDTVTGADMLIAMAYEGCVGVHHRRCSVDKQVEGIKKAKRQHSYFISDPLTIADNATIGEAKNLLARKGVSGLLVLDHQNPERLTGILSRRNIPEGDDDQWVMGYMTLGDKILSGKLGISMQEAEQIMFEHSIEKLPIIDPDREGKILKGLITMRDINFAKSHPYASRDSKGHLLVLAAVGVSGDKWGILPLERAEALIDAGVNGLVIDIAHAHSINMERTIKAMREKFGDFPLIAGNVATYEGTKFLIELGVDAIKVGIGPGRRCRTRLETGYGVPQVQAIRECYHAAKGSGVPLWADGGIYHDGWIDLALMAGASQVMLGGELAGTDEAPGVVFQHPVTKQNMKEYRGMTAPQVIMDETDPEKIKSVLEESQAQEGQSDPVPHVGPVSRVISRIHKHLCSAVSYSGEKTLYEAHQKISEKAFQYFTKQTPAATEESYKR